MLQFDCKSHIYFRYNATFGWIGDNVVEPGDIEDMDVGVSSCPMCWDSVSSALGGRHTHFRYNATPGDIVDNTTEQVDLENIGVAVEILSVGKVR